MTTIKKVLPKWLTEGDLPNPNAEAPPTDSDGLDQPSSKGTSKKGQEPPRIVRLAMQAEHEVVLYGALLVGKIYKEQVTQAMEHVQFELSQAQYDAVMKFMNKEGGA